MSNTENIIGIVGISGIVGQEILTSLNFLNIKYSKLRFFGYGSAGKTINFRNENIIVETFDYRTLNELTYCILAVENDVAKLIIDYAITNNTTCIIIDNSSEYRLNKHVPLVIPEINAHTIEPDSKIIANPNCSTTILVMLLAPLLKINKINIKKIIVSTYQAASGAGKKGYDELILQTKEISENSVLTTNFWNKQYVYNVFSHNSNIDKSTLFNKEELKIINETKKILQSDFKISPTCVRVPVLRSHCLSVHVEFDRIVYFDEIFAELSKFKGVCIENDIEKEEFPEPVKTSGTTDVMIGRIRSDIDDLTCWNFFISGDQLLKGAAYNSVQILDYLIKMKDT